MNPTVPAGQPKPVRRWTKLSLALRVAAFPILVVATNVGAGLSRPQRIYARWLGLAGMWAAWTGAKMIEAERARSS